ncbi:MAG: hypothetical protein OWS74_06645 [Firmicutes bacterium]|nr:hypothetical protein [Bacillota bacterium]
MDLLNKLLEIVPTVSLEKVTQYMYQGIIPYTIQISKFYFDEFLRSETGIYVENKQFTTFAKEITSGFVHPRIIRNGITLGYVNEEGYVHVPDLIATLVLTQYPVKAYIGGTKLFFNTKDPREVSIYYSLSRRVRTPFYTWEEEPEFDLDALEIIAFTIGYSDIVKRNDGYEPTPEEIERNPEYKRYYFLPAFYIAYFLKNKHTFVKNVGVITKVYESVKDTLSVPKYTLSQLIMMANESLDDLVEL